MSELALVKWFAAPEYPDNDPLLVRVCLESDPPPECEEFVFLGEVDPTPVMYELNPRCMFMMRLRGLDVISHTE